MREKLIELLETVVSPNELLCYGEVLVSTSRVADHLIDNDVVQVVRCKDCRYCQRDAYGLWCFNDYEHSLQPDDFCSYGERKDK